MNLANVMTGNMEAFKINKNDIIDLIQSGIEDKIEAEKKLLEDSVRELRTKSENLVTNLYDEIIEYSTKKYSENINKYIEANNVLCESGDIMKVSTFEFVYYYNSLYLKLKDKNGRAITINWKTPTKFSSELKKAYKEQESIQIEISDIECKLSKLRTAEKQLPKLVRKQRAMISRQILVGNTAGKELLEKIDDKVNELINLNQE